MATKPAEFASLELIAFAQQVLRKRQTKTREESRATSTGELERPLPERRRTAKFNGRDHAKTPRGEDPHAHEKPAEFAEARRGRPGQPNLLNLCLILHTENLVRRTRKRNAANSARLELEGKGMLTSHMGGHVDQDQTGGTTPMHPEDILATGGSRQGRQPEARARIRARRGMTDLRTT